MRKPLDLRHLFTRWKSLHVVRAERERVGLPAVYLPNYPQSISSYKAALFVPLSSRPFPPKHILLSHNVERKPLPCFNAMSHCVCACVWESVSINKGWESKWLQDSDDLLWSQKVVKIIQQHCCMFSHNHIILQRILKISEEIFWASSVILFSLTSE